MDLTYKYNLDMEWENFIRTRKSLNHPNRKLPKFEQLAQENNINIKNRKEVIAFYKLQTELFNYDTAKLIKDYQKKWNEIGREVESRNKRLFNTDLDIGEITAYLTIRDSCAYNVENKYFFVSMRSHFQNTIVLHELQHFYTHLLIYPKFKKAGLTLQQCNDFKEALTFLLNIEFKDMMGGYIDKGYEIQQDLRAKMESWWKRNPSMESLVNKYIKLSKK